MAVKAVDVGPGAPVPPTLVFAGGLLAGWLLDGLARLPIAAAGRGATQTTMGVTLVAAGAAIFFWGMLTFASEGTGIMMQEPVRLVVEAGPYRWSRNPQYVGFTAGYIGLALLANAGWALVLLPLVIAVVSLTVIAREERYMQTTFGASYQEYCRRVRRWL
jgi:protein-S-isoprenylcysteine O-methyltransferase Ste14